MPRACEAGDSVKPGSQDPGSSAISLEPVKRATALKFSPDNREATQIILHPAYHYARKLGQRSPVLGQTTSFTFQGLLTDAGTAANGNYDFQFGLRDSQANGTSARIVRR